MTYEWTITTDRLHLTPFAPAHTETLFAINSDPEIMRYLTKTQTRSEIEAYIPAAQARWKKFGYGWWAVFLKGTDTMIGSACLQNLAHQENAPLEIGWRLLSAHQGKGYATEAGQAAMDFGFDRAGVDYICAVAAPENMASQKVMQRLGMTYAGVQTHYDAPCAVYEKHRPM